MHNQFKGKLKQNAESVTIRMFNTLWITCWRAEIRVGLFLLELAAGSFCWGGRFADSSVLGPQLDFISSRGASSFCSDPRTNHLEMYVPNHTRENGGNCFRTWPASASNLYSLSVTGPKTTEQHKNPNILCKFTGCLLMYFFFVMHPALKP